MKVKFSIESAKYGISSLSVEADVLDIKTEEAFSLHSIILAYILSGNTSGPSLGIDLEADDGILHISGNIGNALLLLKNKVLVSEADMEKIFTDAAVKQLMHDATQTNESQDQPRSPGGKI